MLKFKLGDIVLYREIHCIKTPWIALTYVGIGKDGKVYFSNGRCSRPDLIEMVLLTEENVKYLGSRNDIPPRWEPERGEIVAVKSRTDDFWRPMVFIEKSEGGGYVCSSRDCTTEPIFITTWFECEPAYKHFNVPKNPSEDA